MLMLAASSLADAGTAASRPRRARPAEALASLPIGFARDGGPALG
jgi:hypothetical protein